MGKADAIYTFGGGVGWFWHGITDCNFWLSACGVNSLFSLMCISKFPIGGSLARIQGRL